jgi:DNA repair photolyase
MRIIAINKLLSQKLQIGLRFIPLLKIHNYQKIYEDFIKYIDNTIDLKNINSIFIG